MHKNCFIRLIIPGIIFLSLITTGYAAKKTVVGDLQTGLILNYRFPRDQVLTYRRSIDGVRSMEAMGQSIKATIKSDASYSIKGTGVDDQNNLMARIIINDINYAINSPQGNINPDTSGLKGKSFIATHSPNGKQLEVTGVEDLPKIIMGPGVEMDVKDIFEEILPRLPDAAVKIGESWTTPVDNNVKMGQIVVTHKGEATSVLEGIETIQGMECVKIKTHTKFAVEASGTQMGQALNYKGNTTATTTWYFAYKKGVLVRSTSDADEDIKINSGAMEIPRTTKGKVETELVL